MIAVMVNCALIGMSGLATRMFPDLGTTDRVIFIVILEVTMVMLGLTHLNKHATLT